MPRVLGKIVGVVSHPVNAQFGVGLFVYGWGTSKVEGRTSKSVWPFVLSVL